MNRRLQAAALSLAASCSLSAVAVAQDAYVETPADGAGYTRSFDNRWYVAPFVSYTIADENRGTDDGWGGGLSVGKPLNRWLNLEMRGMYSELIRNDDGQGDFDVLDLGIDALLFFRREGFQPFLLLGGGATYDDFSCRNIVRYNGLCTAEGNQWSMMGNAGAGFLVPIGERALFRMDARWRYETNTGDFNAADNFGDWIISAGVQIPLGTLARPVTRTYSLSADALFDFDSDRLRPAGRASINQLTTDLAEVNYDGIDVTGHTDPLGSYEYNQGLSDRRAMTVSSELTANGVPADRVTSRGAGESELKVTEAECANAGNRAALIECLQPNRRVDVQVRGVVPK